MKLIESRSPAAACVIMSSDFANVGNWKMFASEDFAQTYAAENSGRVVDQDGLADKFRDMHKAEGRQPNQSYSGQFVEYPSEEELENLGQSEDEWMESYWDQEYASKAEYAFQSESVYEIETETEDA